MFFFRAAAAVCLLISLCQAQPPCPRSAAACAADSTTAPACCPGAREPADRWGLEFGVGPDFTLTSARGATLSLIRQFNSRRRACLGLSFNLSTASGDGSSEDTYTSEDTTQTLGSISNDNDDVGIDLSAQYQWLSRPHARLRLIGGVGPLLGYLHTLEDADETSFQADTLYRVQHQATETTRWSAGLLASLGSEWRLTNALSLQAGYSLSFSREWREDRDRYHYGHPGNYLNFRETTQKGRSWVLTSPGAKLSLIILI